MCSLWRISVSSNVAVQKRSRKREKVQPCKTPCVRVVRFPWRLRIFPFKATKGARLRNRIAQSFRVGDLRWLQIHGQWELLRRSTSEVESIFQERRGDKVRRAGLVFLLSSLFTNVFLHSMLLSDFNLWFRCYIVLVSQQYYCRSSSLLSGLSQFHQLRNSQHRENSIVSESRLVYRLFIRASNLTIAKHRKEHSTDNHRNGSVVCRGSPTHSFTTSISEERACSSKTF